MDREVNFISANTDSNLSLSFGKTLTWLNQNQMKLTMKSMKGMKFSQLSSLHDLHVLHG
jgi:hypothetical protein